MATFYYSIPGGGVAYRDVAETLHNPNPTAPVVPGWTEIAESVYIDFVANFEADDQAALEARVDDANTARQAAYNDLKASVHTADWDDATIRLITGYYGA